MKWLALLRLDLWAQRWRGNLREGAQALEDRLELAQLEWQTHRQHLVQMLVLAVLASVFAVLALLVLSLAVLVQCWDTPYRVPAAWGLAALWLVVCAIILYKLMAAVQRVQNGFALTRRELAQDWRDLRGLL